MLCGVCVCVVCVVCERGKREEMEMLVGGREWWTGAVRWVVVCESLLVVVGDW